MNPTAKKLLINGAVCVVLGTLLAAYGVDVFTWLSDLAGSNAEIGLGAVSLLISLLRGILVPVGAAIIGAAIAVNVLRPSMEEMDETD